MPLRNRRGRLLVTAAVSAVLTALACHDDVVGPMEKSPHTLGDSRNQTFAEFDLNIPPDNSYPTYGALPVTTTSVSLPPNQWVVLTVTGGVTLAISSLCNSYPDCPGAASHAGQTIDALGIYPSALRVQLSGAGYSNIPLSYGADSVPTALVWSGNGGVISASRGGIQDGVSCYSPWRDPNTGLTGCGVDIFFFAYAYTMMGTQTLKAAVVDPIVVHGTPTTIHPGDSVTFTATLAGSTYQNGNVWTWVAGEVGNQQQNELTNDPPSGGVRVGCNLSPCVYAPTQSGRMYVQSTDYYGHPMRGSSEYIAINAGKFQVTATPSTVVAGGGGVFASKQGPSKPSSALGARMSVRHSDVGSPSTVTFLASTTDNSSFAIQSWSYQPDVGGPGVSSPCAPGVNPCVFDVSQSGTMFVTATINGTTQLASAHVSVIDCPIGDSLFDNANVRDSVFEQFKRTNYFLDQAFRIEQIAAILEDSSNAANRIYVPLIAGSGTNACHSYWQDLSKLYTMPPGKWYVVALVHLHPTRVGDIITFTPCMNGGAHGDVKAVPGPSQWDWSAATSLSDSLTYRGFLKPGESAIPSYAIDPDSIYKYQPHTPWNQQNKKSWIGRRYNPLSANGCP